MLPCEHAFAHHDGIIHHNAKDQNERQHSERADVETRCRKHPDRAHDGDRNTRRDPKGDLKAQEQGQNDEYQNEARVSVLRQGIDPSVQRDRFVNEHVDIEPLGQRLPFTLNIAFHGIRRCNRVLVTHPIHGDSHGWITVVFRFEVALLEGVFHFGDVAELERGAIGQSEHFNFGVLKPPIRLALAPNEDFTACCFDRAAWHIE